MVAVNAGHDRGLVRVAAKRRQGRRPGLPARRSLRNGDTTRTPLLILKSARGSICRTGINPFTSYTSFVRGKGSTVDLEKMGETEFVPDARTFLWFRRWPTAPFPRMAWNVRGLHVGLLVGTARRVPGGDAKPRDGDAPWLFTVRQLHPLDVAPAIVNDKGCDLVLAQIFQEAWEAARAVARRTATASSRACKVRQVVGTEAPDPKTSGCRINSSRSLKDVAPPSITAARLTSTSPRS